MRAASHIKMTVLRLNIQGTFGGSQPEHGVETTAAVRCHLTQHIQSAAPRPDLDRAHARVQTH